MRQSTCKACGAAIVWIRTAGGKPMPCDAQQAFFKQTQGGSLKIMTPNGDVVSAESVRDLNQATGIGYISHFATCPQGESFRRRAGS